MYADTVEKMAAATAEVKLQSHLAFAAQVESFLKTGGVAPAFPHWCHNTNNFAEATIRALKEQDGGIQCGGSSGMGALLRESYPLPCQQPRFPTPSGVQAATVQNARGCSQQHSGDRSPALCSA